ncbi:TonB-dependent receptor plug domain-containing protein [Aquimarina sp. RZ0]|uniref:TonB-dependent receptor n=1 Tax=Aquimarina sp. RZ0 TaxID=2607730 RepID=UPI00165F0558|nr:TonB-dependent receptor plug domain-containing protein [Aquimarina sp. RZ0]
MLDINHINTVICFLICFSYNRLDAQIKEEPNNKFSILELLTHFEKDKQITFSYDPKSINEIQLIFKKPIKSLQNIELKYFLEVLENQTSFDIKKNDTNYILYKVNKPITITGTVINLYSGEVLSGVLVTDLDSSVITDSKGVFRIQTKTFRTLEFYRSGFKNTIVSVDSVNKNHSIQISMTEQTEILDEVVLIHDYLTFGVDKNRDGSIEISPQTMKLIPGLIEPDVMEAIQLLPGINSSSEGVNTINIRGSTFDQNLILWDGIKIYTKGHFFDKISPFNPNLVDKATIYRNGTSSKYGGRIGGIIDINTKDEIINNVSGNAGINLTHADANINLPIRKKIEITLAGRHSLENFISDKKNEILKTNVLSNSFNRLDNNLFLTNKITYYDFSPSIKWNISKNNSLKISGIYLNNSLQVTSNFPSESFSTIEVLDQLNKGTSIGWNSKLHTKLLSFLQIQYSNHLVSEKNTRILIPDPQSDTFIEPSTIFRTSELIDISGVYNMTYTINDTSKILGGYEQTHNKINNDKIQLESSSEEGSLHKLNTQSLYSEYIYNNRAYGYRIGIRANYYSDINKPFLEPRLYGFAKLTKALSVNLAAEIKSQAIRQELEDTQLEIDLDALNGDSWLIAGLSKVNQNAIPLLTSNQVGAGVVYKRKDLSIDIESYYKKSKGVITILYLPDENDDELILGGNSSAYGVDIFIKQKINKYRTWLGYSWSENILEFPIDQRKRFRSKTNHKHIINWSHTIDFKNLQLGISWNYRSGNVYSIPSDASSNVFLYDSIGTRYLPDYHRLNASLLYSYNWNNKLKATVGISFQNILDRKNIIDRRYSTVAQDPDFTEPEFSFNVQDGYTLDAYRVDYKGQPFTPDFVFRLSF